VTNRRRLAVAGVLLLTALSSATVFIDGWWLYVAGPTHHGAIPDPGMAGRLALAGSALVSVISGLIARARRPDNPIGIWLIVSGLCGPLAFMVGAASPLLTVASAVVFVVAAGVGSAIPISFPSGRLDGRAPAAVAAVAITCALYRVEQVLLFDPIGTIAGWTQPNPFFIKADPSFLSALDAFNGVYGLVFLLGFGFWLARRWWRLSGPARLSIAPVLAGGLVFVGASVTQSVADEIGVHGHAMDAIGFAHTLTLYVVPVGFLAGLLRVRMARSAIADLVVELGETPEPAQLRRALVTALGDRTLEVVLWSADTGVFVDGSGARVDSLEALAGGRAVTMLERDGAPLAAILHDPALLEDPGLVASVAAAVRLTVENDRLTAEVQDQLAEVRASRARIVDATDAERRRIERNIHDGAQQRLVALSLALGRARSQAGNATNPELETTLAEASDEVRSALAELRELARGIHPSVLTQAGLEPAIRSLVDRAVVPTELRVDLPSRLPDAVEAAAYFVVSEALTNAGKHARAGSACVALAVVDGDLVVEVSDDGCGGADPGRGSGLRGLGDRVEAIGGRLDATSPAGGGTIIRATLPIAAAGQ
jgi:signal transduction histidine kinase